MRNGILISAFLPFLYYATKDTLFHFRGRRVSLTEHLLHVAVGVSLAIVIANALLGHFGVMIAGLVCFAIAGGLDEYHWHRGIPEAESDLHAKEHLALLLFVVAALVVHWLDNHDWRLPQDLVGMLPGAPQATDETIAKSPSNDPPTRPWWRTAAIPLLLVPYAYCGLRDNLHHFQRRRVSWTERLLHAAIVVALVAVVPEAMFGSGSIMLAGLLLFLFARSLDEWLFHRNLPGAEAQLHSNTHFAFLSFVILASGLDLITQRSWT